MLPVSGLDASEAKNSTVEAISPGWPMRRIGLMSSQVGSVDWSSVSNRGQRGLGVGGGNSVGADAALSLSRLSPLAAALAFRLNSSRGIA